MSITFGTDGVRGVANVDLTPEVVMALGRATAHVLGADAFLVGRDTRVSSPILSSAVTTGLAAEGADVTDLGVLPTPALARAAAARDIPAVMISASHNPYPDNGVKVLGRGGRKLSDELEARIAAAVDRPGRDGPVGQVRQESVDEWYVDAVVASLDGRRLDGLRVVIDCACGAASFVAAHAFRAAGAAVTAIHDDPGDGTRINDGCGSTHPESLQQTVVAAGAHVGLAFDGDADRVLAVDNEGALVDGDSIMAICALDWRRRGRLRGDTVVVTVMTNLGFRLAMVDHGVSVIETNVGDRYVLEALEAGNYSLGGEQSGHIILRDLATTGDGILTGLHLLDVLTRSGQRLAALSTSAMTRLPQVLRSVKVGDRSALDGADAVWAAVAAVEAELGDRGRVLLRPSGTEPVVRVMVEAPTETIAAAAAQRLAALVAEL
ncbi:MAG: phosphoglucosamine mutase [Actinobacteria bacterium]|nr:phosphoglucosamine mutase [Actinomycetota bacterium]